MIRARNTLALLALFVWAFRPSAQADSDPNRYSLDDGKVRFVCEGPDVTVPAWGQFGTVAGALSIDPNDLSTAAGNIDVYMVSIRTDDSAWDAMFRHAGFLEIDEMPTSRFVLNRVRGAEMLEERKWVPMKLEGQFTLHGKTRKITMPATAKWSPADPLTGQDERIHVRASFHITWDEYEIAMPTGHTRTFAGDGALIHADLEYAPSLLKQSRRRRR